jgi:hypothetical protein
MHSTQSSQSTQPMQSTQRRQLTQPRQPTHITSATESRLSTDPAIPTLPDTPALPATATLPETATLPATAALPATATLPVTPALPATATLPETATPRFTALLPATATLPPTSALPATATLPSTPVSSPTSLCPPPLIGLLRSSRWGTACRIFIARHSSNGLRDGVAGNLRPVPVLTRAVEAVFQVLAHLRSARAVHPSGALFAGRVELDAPASPTVAVLGDTAHPALIRISKGAGTPNGLPDLLGLAVRLTDLPDGPVDLLYSTVGRHRWTGALLAPATGWCTRPYTTLLPYRADGERVTLGLWPQEPDRARGTDPQAAREAVRQAPLVFAVMEKRARTPWTPIGRLVLDLPMPDGAADDGPDGTDPVTFEPVVHAHPRLRPVRLLSAVRVAAYTGSRRGRGAPDVLPARLGTATADAGAVVAPPVAGLGSVRPTGASRRG